MSGNNGYYSRGGILFSSSTRIHNFLFSFSLFSHLLIHLSFLYRCISRPSDNVSAWMCHTALLHIIISSSLSVTIVDLCYMGSSSKGYSAKVLIISISSRSTKNFINLFICSSVQHERSQALSKERCKQLWHQHQRNGRNTQFYWCEYQNQSTQEKGKMILQTPHFIPRSNWFTIVFNRLLSLSHQDAVEAPILWCQQLLCLLWNRMKWILRQDSLQEVLISVVSNLHNRH